MTTRLINFEGFFVIIAMLGWGIFKMIQNF